MVPLPGLVATLRSHANDCEDMERWATPELAPLLRRAADVIEERDTGNRVREKFAGFIATVRSMKCAHVQPSSTGMGAVNDAIANAVNARIDLILAAVPVELAALTAARDTEGKAASESVRRERAAAFKRERYENMSTNERCQAQGDGFINDYD